MFGGPTRSRSGPSAMPKPLFRGFGLGFIDELEPLWGNRCRHTSELAPHGTCPTAKNDSLPAATGATASAWWGITLGEQSRVDSSECPSGRRDGRHSSERRPARQGASNPRRQKAERLRRSIIRRNLTARATAAITDGAVTKYFGHSQRQRTNSRTWCAACATL